MTACADADVLNKHLREMYLREWGSFETLKARCPEYSWPHLVCVSGGQVQTKVRLAVVGQQTKGWASELGSAAGAASVERLQKVYADFMWGEDSQTRRRRNHSVFFRAAKRLQRALNPQSGSSDFIWLNVYPCDWRGREPAGGGEVRFFEQRLLAQCLEILCPDAVVFLTGPRLGTTPNRGDTDGALRMMFPALKVTPTTLAGYSLRDLAWLQLSADGPMAIRTHHPHYLFWTGKWSLLDRVADQLRYRLDSHG